MSILMTAVAEILVLLFFWRLSKKEQENARPIAAICLGFFLIGVFVVTLGYRTFDSAGDTNLILFSTFRKMFAPTWNRLQEWGFPRGLKELKWIGYKSWESVVLNFLMLVPLGYLVPLIMPTNLTWCKVVLIGFGLSLIIETSQLVFHRGWFDVDDIVLNTLGALIGYGLYKQILNNSATQCRSEEDHGK